MITQYLRSSVFLCKPPILLVLLSKNAYVARLYGWGRRIGSMMSWILGLVGKGTQWVWRVGRHVCKYNQSRMSFAFRASQDGRQAISPATARLSVQPLRDDCERVVCRAALLD
jgi:hypothetical protein